MVPKPKLGLVEDRFAIIITKCFRCYVDNDSL